MVGIVAFRLSNQTNMAKLTANFDSAEFDCRDGTKVPAELKENVKELADNLQILRDEIGEPIHINSAYRHEAYNKKIGGVKSSQHIKAKAADITAKSYTPKKLAAVIERLIKEERMKQGGIGIYPGFTHYDIRGTKSRW